jgi:hypothetical protein
MKFAHLGDCHLGGWRHPELKELNLKSFQEAVSRCIKERVEFILIAGDLFDTSYPPIETLKETFLEFRKLKEANIPVFLIAGSHDFSAAGKSFLDVIEKAGFCKNVSLFEERDEKIILHPTLVKNVAIYGYPGKKSGLEVDDLERIKLDDSPGFYKILMLHTSLKDAIGTLPIKAVDYRSLPKVDYIALGHLHINYCKESRAYSGPIFPNNISELEELKHGFFYIVENGKARKEEINLKDVLVLDIEIKESLSATGEIISLLQKENVRDKIVIVKLHGVLKEGKLSDIDFSKVENYLKSQGAFVFLRSTTRLHLIEPEVKLDSIESGNIESEIIKRFEEKNPSKFNHLISLLSRSLQVEKQDDEKKINFEERVISEIKKVLPL